MNLSPNPTRRDRPSAVDRERDVAYRDLFRSLEMGFCVFELLFDAGGLAFDARIVEGNPHFERLTGRTDLAGRTFRELFEGIDDSWFATYQEAVEQGRTVRFERHHAPTDHWYELHASPFGAEGSQRLAVVFTNITERKRAEDARLKSEQKYRTLFQSLDEAFCLIEMIFDEQGNAIDFRFLETNPAFIRHTGVDLRGKRVREAIDGYEQFWIDLYAKVLRTGVVVREEHPVQGLGGDWFRVSAFRNGDPSRDARVGVVFTNITERKRAEEALQDFNRRLEQEVHDRTEQLRSSSELLRAVLDASVFNIDYMVAVREDGAITDFEWVLANAAARKHSDSKDTVPLRYAQTFPGIRETGIFAHLERVVETGEKADFEVRYDRDGYDHWFHLVAVKLGDGVIITSEDITERKRAEEEALRLAQERRELEERQRQDLLRAILDTQESERRRIAESLHNGIGQILYGIQLNLDRTRLRAGERWQERHQEQHVATQRLLQGAIEETRRISHELMPSILEDFGLQRALQEIFQQFHGSLEVEYAFENLPKRLEAYLEIALYRTVQELFNNIVKHAKALRVSVRLGYDGRTYALEVRDDGVGFPEAPKAEGIGLKTIRDKIALLGGEFRVESGDAGTTVRIRIPKAARA